MAEAMKNIYNYELLHRLALDIASVYRDFQTDDFLRTTISETWDLLCFFRLLSNCTAGRRKIGIFPCLLLQDIHSMPLRNLR